MLFYLQLFSAVVANEARDVEAIVGNPPHQLIAGDRLRASLAALQSAKTDRGRLLARIAPRIGDFPGRWSARTLSNASVVVRIAVRSAAREQCPN